MGRGVDDLRARLALIVKLNDLAKAGDSNAAPVKTELAAAVDALTKSFAKVNDQITKMKAAEA